MFRVRLAIQSFLCVVALSVFARAEPVSVGSAPPRQRLAAPAGPRAAAAPVDLELWIARARALRLARSTSWLRLGHYQGRWFGGSKSQADARPFFLAPEGKTDPEAELEATLRALFAPGPDEATDGLQHPYCRFPARRLFLVRALQIPAGALPARRCERLAEFLSLLRPAGATLVFSSYYLNNPASAFGHTFLRIEKANDSSGAQSSDLLDYGVDFSADVDTGNSFLYALKGLFGLFPGNFHKVPYHHKVREYNDFESRDLWEYELNLSSDEIQNVVLHLWELGSTYFAYYYLNENCSYHVLGLLEVANPRFSLLEHLGWPVIPADTVKALYANPGLVRAVHYRPSNRTQLKLRLGLLSAAEQNLLEKLMSAPTTVFPAGMRLERQLKVLDTALDLFDVRLARDLVKERSEIDQEAEVQQELLVRRAEYEVATEPAHFAPPFRTMPHLGHGSRRLGLGSGWERERGYFHLAQFRVALHDLADSIVGYPAWAAIEFLPITLRYRIEKPRLTLEEATLVRVESLTPWSRFEHPLAFRLDVGVARQHDSGCSNCLAAYGDVGGGLSLAPFGDAVLVYALGEVRLAAPMGSGLLDFARVGVGPRGGLGLRFTDDFSFWGSGRWSYLPGQKPEAVWALDGKLRWQYTRGFALGVEASLHPESAWAQGVSYLYF